MYNGSLVVAGEFMGTRPFSMHDEPEFLDMIKILREADATYCHLEMNIHSFEGYPGTPFAVSALQADSVIANELKWAGIDLVSCANNHNCDWGREGMFRTIDHLNKAGIVHAGIGNNLEEAREPAYFESSAGRVALISMSSGHPPYDSASPCKAPSRGRPGVNPLRIMQKYVLDQETIELMKEVFWKKIGLRQKPNFYVKPEEGETCISVRDANGGERITLRFVPGDKPQVISIPNKWDFEGNMRAIKEARRQADLVLVCHHVTLDEGAEMVKPLKFVPTLAKQCIDAGADVYISHGWHRQVGLEIYNNKPIFYGTGNFFAQSQFLKRIPSDSYEGHGFSLDDLGTLTPVDWHNAREKSMAHWLEEAGSVIAVLGMQGGRFHEMKFYPVILGYDYGLGANGKYSRQTGVRMDGRPTLADPANGERIIKHVKRLSEAFNTRIEIRDGVGVVSLL